ncbi:MAG: hypothetical protein ABEI52_12680, partial [Halobacteriaceae archaeon]
WRSPLDLLPHLKGWASARNVSTPPAPIDKGDPESSHFAATTRRWSRGSWVPMESAVNHTIGVRGDLNPFPS